MLTYILLDEYLGIDRVSCITGKEYSLEEKHLAKIDLAVERLKKYEPIQYITGKSYFSGREFFVRQGVLIPRPETEELILLVKNRNNVTRPSLMDIGCGSGCIAVTLALEIPDSRVYALDKSIQSAVITRFNARRLAASVQVFHYDIFQEGWPFPVFDILISNPPYVTESEKVTMKPNVLKYEPAEALFVPDDNPIRYYQRIVELTKTGLKPGGLLIFEINENFGREIFDLMNSEGFQDVRILKDIHGKERFAFGRRAFL